MQIRSAFGRPLHDRSGAAMVEFIFAVPILLILFAGIVELGTMMHYYHAVTDGSRAAARYLSRVEDPCDQAEGSIAPRGSPRRARRIGPSTPCSTLADIRRGLGKRLPGHRSGMRGRCAQRRNDHVRHLLPIQRRLRRTFPLRLQEGLRLNGVHQEVHIGA